MRQKVFSFGGEGTIMTGVVQRCTGYFLYTFVLFYFILIFRCAWLRGRMGMREEW